MNLAEQTILITGANGFVGTRAAELALERGLKVRGLVRSAEKASTLRSMGVEIVVGDVTDPEVAKVACDGTTVVLHTAAVVNVGGDPVHFQRVNIGGSANMASAAKQAGVKCFVHLSSVMVYGFNYPNQVTETGALRGENNPYCETKIDSEVAVLKLNHPPEFGVIIIRPGDIYGPRGSAWVTYPIQRMRQKEFILPRMGTGCVNHVYVDNLLDGIFLAVEQEAYGETFNITDGAATTAKEFFTRLAQIAELPAPKALPTPLLRTLFWLYVEDLKKKGQTPEVYEASIDWLCRPHGYSIQKAEQQLGYRPRVSLEEGMARTAAWFKTDGC
jgi:nucleoside-diphosphate-sugar epimerase